MNHYRRWTAVVIATTAAFGTAVTVAALEPGNADPDASPTPLSGGVTTSAPAPDGAVYLGGGFINVGGDPDLDHIVRFHPDGSVDESFSPPSLNSMVSSISATATGGVLVAGGFANAGGLDDHDRIVILDADGAIDTSFTPPLLTLPVWAAAQNDDGDVLAGGVFTNAGGNPDRDYLVRLNADGTIDESFNPPPLSNWVSEVNLADNGAVVVGGNFVDVDGDPDRDRIVRLDAVGNVDESFNPPPLNDAVFALAHTPNGGLLVGGDFVDVNGDPDRDYLVRLNADGTVDESFNPPPLNDSVFAVTHTANGDLLVGGRFVDVNGDPDRDRIVRLRPDGAVDASYRPPPLNNTVQTITELSDGAVFVGGAFTDVNADPDQDRHVRLVDRPSPPLGPEAVGQLGSVEVSWQPPARGGGLDITSYTVTATPGGQQCQTTDVSCEVFDLAPDTDYTFTVSAHNAAGTSDPSTAAGPVQLGGPDIVATTPARFWESRPGHATVDGLHQGTGQLNDDEIIEITIAGRNNIPADATAVVLNTAVTDTTGPGFVTVFPCGNPPLTSTVNYTTPQQTTANGSIIALSDTGTLCVYASTATHALIDITGYHP